MTDASAVWRPLGVDSEDEIAEYDALHDDVPPWMAAAFWAWVPMCLASVEIDIFHDRVLMVNVPLVEEMGQRLRISLPPIRTAEPSNEGGRWQRERVLEALGKHPKPMQIADYLLAHSQEPYASRLEEILVNSKSVWAVGERLGKRGLVRRVPEGVQVAADATMARSGRAGVRLAKAWEALYGIEPNPSESYRLAIQAVEDAAIPVVSPANERATLGTVLAQIESQGNWSLPMEREHDRAPTGDVLVGMMRMLWHGQHDRHGGNPSAPGNVSQEEASVAVGVAVTLVGWFAGGLVSRV